MHLVNFKLLAVAPFRLDLTVWALRRRSRNLVDDWNGSCYTRVFIIDNSPVKVEVRQETENAHLSVSAYSHHAIPKLKSRVANLLNAVLGLKLNLEGFYKQVGRDQILSPLVLKFKGVKPPRFPTIFETLSNAIAFQQLSLEAGLSLLNNLTQKYGIPFETNEDINYSFPEACDIMKCTEEELMFLGFSRRKSATLISVASAIVHQAKLSNLDKLPNEEVIKLLCQFKGIGRWSAEYTLLRGLGRTNILPGDDVAVRKSIEGLFKLRKKPDYEKIKEIEKKWQPYAGVVYFHFLLEKLYTKQII